LAAYVPVADAQCNGKTPDPKVGVGGAAHDKIGDALASRPVGAPRNA
jgi:hypothetical protein